jgi:hypothetical protein
MVDDVLDGFLQASLSNIRECMGVEADRGMDGEDFSFTQWVSTNCCLLLENVLHGLRWRESRVESRTQADKNDAPSTSRKLSFPFLSMLYTRN